MVIHQDELNEQISLFAHASESNDAKTVNQTDQIIDQLTKALPDVKIVKASSLIDETPVQKKYLKIMNNFKKHSYVLSKSD